MKQKELQDQIEGYFLLGHYLQAFLVQTAYIEGLIKLLTDFTHFTEIETRSNAANEIYKSKFIQCLKKEIKRQSVSRSIRLLKDSDTIQEPLSAKLQNYFQIRNEIIHDLVNQMDSPAFEDRVKIAVELGRHITQEDSFKEMIELVAGLQEETSKSLPVPTVSEHSLKS